MKRAKTDYMYQHLTRYLIGDHRTKQQRQKVKFLAWKKRRGK